MRVPRSIRRPDTRLTRSTSRSPRHLSAPRDRPFSPENDQLLWLSRARRDRDLRQVCRPHELQAQV
ncbi:unnamed protein product [Trichogramma brassicae]|uniref:Uncharacterized protein n=1 Tax=Trichogramma brassicae TaxID=86971 RepID=A0A6H5I810_9HYME|nr:unnamed protein product [Trichogramma brassicae]